MTDLFDTDLFLELKCRSDFLFAELKIFLACGSCRFRSCLHGLFPLFEPGGWASSWREGLTNRLTTTVSRRRKHGVRWAERRNWL